jgi:iron complex outermembrane receptor protein
VSLAVDWPIADRLKTRWTAAADQNDGFLKNPAAPITLGDEDDSLLRTDLVWQPTGNLSLRFAANAENSSSSDPRFVRISNAGHPGYIAYNVLAGNPGYLDAARAIDPAFPGPPAVLAGDRYTPETHQSGYPGGLLGEWQTRSDLPGPTAVFDSRYATLTLDWNIAPQLSLRSLTSHVDADSRQAADYDASEFTLRSRIFLDRTTTTTQELHLTGSHFGGRLQSLLGLYYHEYENQHREYIWADWEFAIPNTGPNPPNLNATAVGYVRAWGTTVGNNDVAGYVPLTSDTADLLNEQQDTDRAFFGQLTIGLLETLDLVLGFRFTTDDGSFTEYVPAEAFRPLEPGAVAAGDLYAPAAVIRAQEEPDFGTATTPRASIAYRPTGEIYVYASYAEGFTSSEVLPNQGTAPSILGPEIVTTRELGLRAEWLDDRLRLNATYFDSRWDGLRVREFVADPNNPARSFLVWTSQGIAHSEGLELELFYLPDTRWELDFGLGLLDTEYLDIGDPPANNTGLQPGIPFRYAPEASYSLGVRYRVPVASGEILFAANYGWMDEYQRAPANQFQTKNPDGSTRDEPAYGVLNGRIVYRPLTANWQLSLFGTNLTNAWYVNGGLDARLQEGFDFVTIGRPREVGVDVQFVFD